MIGVMASKERIAGQTGLPLGDTDGVIVVQENQTAIRQNFPILRSILSCLAKVMAYFKAKR